MWRGDRKRWEREAGAGAEAGSGGGRRAAGSKLLQSAVRGYFARLERSELIARNHLGDALRCRDGRIYEVFVE